MQNMTQIERYKRLIDFIHNNFKEELTTEQLESVCFYSYRNMNRIFRAIHQESIGQYIKRLRIEKAAEYIKFSDHSISEIANEVAFEEIAAFSKAYKNKFGISPTTYRKQKGQLRYGSFLKNPIPLDYSIVNLPPLRVLYRTYIGSYQSFSEIDAVWNTLLDYSYENDVLNNETIYLGEILDDDDITEDNKCRYNAAVVIPESLDLLHSKEFSIKTIPSQKYVKFAFEGNQQESVAFYDRIFSSWISQISLELADRPIVEIYSDNSSKKQTTHIHIPVM